MDLHTGSSKEFNKETSVGNIFSLLYNNSKLEYPENEDLDVLIAHNAKGKRVSHSSLLPTNSAIVYRFPYSYFQLVH